MTTAPHWFGSFGAVILAGQVTVGGCVSLTVTVKPQVLSGLFTLASIAVQVTDDVPTGKNEPEAGEQFTVMPGQLSPAVGGV